MNLSETLSQKTLLAGILPLVSAKHANFLHNEVTGVFIPDEAR